MECIFVKGKSTVAKTISAKTEEVFKVQFQELLNAAKEPEGIVYVFRSESSIPRLQGDSPIIYIGKTKHSLYSRYKPYINDEAKEYWTRYQHIISKYGDISIDIYETDNPKQTENRFLYLYHQQCMELPPINLQSYKTSLFDKFNKSKP